MVSKEKNRRLKGILYMLLFVTANLLVFTITTYTYRKGASDKVPKETSESKEKDKVTIENIKDWQHPIKGYFKKHTLAKVELLNKETYPIFYVNKSSLKEEEIVEDYTSGTYSAMLEANGYWDFEIRSLDNKWVKIKGDKKQKKIIEIVFEGKVVDLKGVSLSGKNQVSTNKGNK
ncbi:MAG: hypothetical protein GX370_00800 [Clostridia bacterium]|jgi:hypothetical protein|nr:hypothetical protein [Clostridia bacterium]